MLEISTSDETTKAVLTEIAQNAEDPDNVFCVPQKGHGGMDVLTLVIENYGNLAAGTAALIATLKGRMPTIIINKNGMEIRGGAKEAALDGK